MANGDRLSIVDRRGKEVLLFENSYSPRGVNVFWSPDSQRVVLAVQWKWSAFLEAAQLVGGKWNRVPFAEMSRELDTKAESSLGIKVGEGAWSEYGDTFASRSASK